MNVNKVIIALAILTAGFVYATFFVLFDDGATQTAMRSVSTNMLASAESALGAVLGDGLPPAIKAIPHIKREVVKQEVATTTATTTEEAAVDTSEWKIFYTPTNFDGASAYTLRYPPKWNMHEDDGKNILLYDADDSVYNLTFSESLVNLSRLGKFGNATTTKFGDAEYVKEVAVQGATTTLVAYIPQSEHKSFKVAYGSLPPKESSKYEKIFDAIISTVAVQPAMYNFEIRNVYINTPMLNLTTVNAIGAPAKLAWRVIKSKEFYKSDNKIDIWIENEAGEKLTDLGQLTTESKSPAEFTLPPLCGTYFATLDTACIEPKNLVFGVKYRVVMAGGNTNIAYSNWFTIYNDVQFKDVDLSVAESQAEDVDDKGFVVQASVTNVKGSGARYVVYFSDGEYSELTNIGGGKFTGKWLRTFAGGADSERYAYLIRTTKEALDNAFYGASTIEQVSSYADVLAKEKISR